MNEAIRKLAKKVEQVEGIHLQAASAEDIQRAEQAGFPSELIEFYRELDPVECIEFEQRIWSIRNALVENEGAVPGCALFPHGFVVFAGNLFGDAYCIDTNVTTSEGRHPVVLFPHDAIEEDAPISAIMRFRLEAGRLHHKSLSEQDLFQVGVVPAGGEAFVLHADGERVVVLQKAQRRATQNAEVGVGMAQTYS
jgi:hypothetical protein